MGNCSIIVKTFSALALLVPTVPCLANNTSAALLGIVVAQGPQSTEEKVHKEQEARREAERRIASDSLKHQDTYDSKRSKAETAPATITTLSPSKEEKRSQNTSAERPTPSLFHQPTPGEASGLVGGENLRQDKVRLETEMRRLVELEKISRNRWWRYRPITWSDCYLPAKRTREYFTTLLTTVVSSNLTPAGGSDAMSVVHALPANSISNTYEAEAASYPPVRSATDYSYPDKRFANRDTQRSHIAVVVAPGDAERRTSFGLQYISNKGYGVGLWFSGSFGPDTDIIEATIPHEDYYTVTRWSSYSVQGLLGIGSESATFIFGAGLSVEKTIYVDISNVTGWKWYGGETREIKPCAIAGCRLSLGDRVSLQFGYDTSRRAFFGCAAAF